jgi:CubicO group peptidase (beta-lactamase class C family)
VTTPPEIAELLARGVAERAFTHGSLSVVRDGEVLLAADVPAGPRAFDVASVTKAVTATAVLQHFPLDRPVPWLEGAPTIGQLLSHSSGLPAWRPLFAHAALELEVKLEEFFEHAFLIDDVKRVYRENIADTRPTAPRPTYSDLGFLALGFELEAATGKPLRRLFEAILAPDERSSGRLSGQGPKVPTGVGRPRAGNPPVEPEVVAKVGGNPLAEDVAPDDDNAACAGWTCGHAGLVATAADLARFGDRLRRDADDDANQLLSPEKARLLFTPVSGSRSYGLDTPSGETTSLGTVLGRGPKGAAGHLGFTGCSLWIDRDARLSVAFLTDAVALARPSAAIRSFRPLVHDTVAKVLGITRR